MLDRLEGTPAEERPRSGAYRSGEQERDRARREAERLVADAAASLGMKGASTEQFAALPRSDPRRAAVAWAICKRTSMPQGWIAERLALRSAANVSVQVQRFSKRPDRELPPAVRKWRRALGS